VHCHRILRLVEGLNGDVGVDVQLHPTFDYARARTDLVIRSGIVIARSGSGGLLFEHPMAAVTPHGDGSVHGRINVRAGERRWFVVTHFGDGDAARYGGADPDRLLAETQHNWDRWSGQCTYDGHYHHLVRISARVLKLLTFGPTGAL